MDPTTAAPGLSESAVTGSARQHGKTRVHTLLLNPFLPCSTVCQWPRRQWGRRAVLLPIFLFRHPRLLYLERWLLLLGLFSRFKGLDDKEPGTDTALDEIRIKNLRVVLASALPTV